jgi:hypothetical protein
VSLAIAKHFVESEVQVIACKEFPSGPLITFALGAAQPVKNKEAAYKKMNLCIVNGFFQSLCRLVFFIRNLNIQHFQLVLYLA